MQKWWETVDTPPLKTRDYDYVEFSVKYLGTGETKDYGERICFAVLREHLDKVEWDVRPSRVSDRPLSFGDYLRWVGLCKENGVMPLNAEPYEVDGKLRIKMSGCYHQVFAGLNCYRWAINHNQLPKLVLDLIDAKPTVNFFQAFHYALKKYNYWSGHSFSDAITPNPSLKGSKTTMLVHSLGMAWFFRGNANSPCRVEYSIEEGREKSFYGNRMPTSQAINRYLVDLGFERDDGATGWAKDAINVNHMRLKCEADVLWDEWDALYRMEEPNKEKALRYYNDVLAQKS